MKRILGLCVVVSLSLSGLAAAEVGDLTFTTDVLPLPAEHGYVRAAQPKFSNAAVGEGIVNSRAVVATLEPIEAGPSLPVMIAIDSDNPTATVPNLMRIDITGQGRFEDAPTVAMDKPTGDFGPADVEFKLDGKTIPARVWWRYVKNNNGYAQCSMPYRAIQLSL